MTAPEDREREAWELVRGHLAPDMETARKILEEMAERRRKSDLVILYTDFLKVRGAFGKNLFDEKVYNNSHIRIAFIPSGPDLLDKIPSSAGLVFGKIIEFISKAEKERRRLAALAKNFECQGEQYQGKQYYRKEGVFLTDYSLEELESTRGTLALAFEKRYPKDLFRLEFHPIAGDSVFGMFSAWNSHEISEDFSLVLWTPRNRVLFL